MLHIEIPKRSSCCSKGGEPFTPGSDYYSVLLRNDGEEAYYRHDYCSACWEHNKTSLSQKGKNSAWKSKVPAKKELSELPKQRDARALYLLKEVLANRESPTAHAEAFILALYLARRRLIVLRREFEQPAKPTLCVYEIIETEEMIGVPKMALSDLHVGQIQADLAKKFKA